MTARAYYIADSRTRTRLRRTHRTLLAAVERCEGLNRLDPGRYQCGDWVPLVEVGTDKPREYPWQTTNSPSP